MTQAPHTSGHILRQVPGKIRFTTPLLKECIKAMRVTYNHGMSPRFRVVEYLASWAG